MKRPLPDEVRCATAEGPVTKKIKIDFADTIKIVVGRDIVGAYEQTFVVPKNFITSRTEAISLLYDRPTYTGAVEIKDTDPDHFSTYLQVVHTDQVVLEDSDGYLDYRKLWERRVHLYLVATKLRDPASMNIIMDDIFETLNTTKLSPWTKFIAYAANEILSSDRCNTFVSYAVEKGSVPLFAERTSNRITSRVSGRCRNGA